MHSAEERIETDDGVRLWVKTSGDRSRAAVVLCHGGPGLWDELDAVAEMVADLAYVIQWDQRGAGRSDLTGPYSVARSIADLECVRSSLDIHGWVVAGHSWGAGLALRYALAHRTRTRALIYMSGTDLGWSTTGNTAYRQERLRRLGPYLERWNQLCDTPNRTPAEDQELDTITFATDFADRENASGLAATWAYTRYAINREANAAIGADVMVESGADLAARCAHLDTPAFVVHGAEDPRPFAGPAALAECLPHSTLIVLPGVGHVPWAERPELLRRALRDAIAAVT